MKKLYFTAVLSLLAFSAAQAQNTPDSWIHIYTTENGKTRVVTAHSDSVKGIEYNGSETAGFSKLNYTFLKEGQDKVETFDIDMIDSVEVGPHVPTLIIKTNTPLDEIKSKDYYEDMTIEVKGYGTFEDLAPYSGTIKGRGNSTWAQFPKKPYRLKFSKKVSLCGLLKAKSYVLLANFIDPSMLRNAVAFKVGHMIGMPYTNSSIPVNVIFNGINKGAYQLSEKIGFNDASLPIEDEEGILFCLEQDNIDEIYYSKTPTYGVNYMVKDPDLAEVAETLGTTAQALWQQWKNDFESFERMIPSGDLTKVFDVESLVDYVFVYNLTSNQEVQHPKSVYMYKENIDATYKLGPLWDFDWAYTFGGSYQEGARQPKELLFTETSKPGSKFFLGLIKNPYIQQQFRDLYQKKWDAFKEQLPELWDYIDQYAHFMKASAAENGEIWPTDTYNRQNGRNIGSTDIFPTHVENLKKWLQERINYIDTHKNFGIYQ